MNKTFKKTTSFITVFPIGSLVTLDQFDAWAIENEFYSEDHMVSRTVLNTYRKRLRMAINLLALSHKWTDKGNEKFQIDSHRPKKDYRVNPPGTSYIVKSDKRPGQEESFHVAKKKGLQRLRSNTELEKLSDNEQWKIALNDRFNRFYDDHAEVCHQLRLGVKSDIDKLSPPKGGFTLIDID